jgi:hypothetical protein
VVLPALPSNEKRSPASGRQGRPKGATEQPGNSFKYLYWRLAEKEFQQLCSALLRQKFDPVRCFPVGMADGGIDAISNGDIIYQVKWTSKFESNPEKWLSDAISGEREKIRRLVTDRGISKYVLMTSVAGTTASPGAGSIQKLQPQLDAYALEFGIPVECWWQSDLDAEVDAAPDAIKWSYQEMLAGSDAIRYLVSGSQLEAEAAQMRDTMLQVMATQWREDSKVKFRQVDMDRVDVAEIFVDVQASVQSVPRRAMEALRITDERGPRPTGAVQRLLTTAFPMTFLLGVPGQGKSTLSQYLCQIHRAAILPFYMLGDRTTPDERLIEPRLPLRVDLRDYAEWLAGRDPFGDDEPIRTVRRRSKVRRSLEIFLAHLCSFTSGGRAVSVEQLQSLLTRYPTILVLDGLDEVADPELRQIVVEEINRTAVRMSGGIKIRPFQILVTARPNAAGLSEPDLELFQTLKLEPLSPALQTEFVTKWCDVNDLQGRERHNLRRIFRDRASLDHVAQLADNPMQLTILLFLISRKGDAVPVSRTPLYTDYMTTLMDREVSRHFIARNQVPLVQEVTAFLGWHMHSGMESSPSAGRMTLVDIETTLLIYLRKTGGPDQEASRLFKAASDRFWALTSKEDGTFEFAVQPVREYFAAKFLAEWVGRERSEPLQKQAILRSLIERPYWLNTARFYAGFASPNELAALRYGLEEAIVRRVHPLQERAAAWTLLSDGIFSINLPVQRDVIRLLADDLTVSLVDDLGMGDGNFPRLAPAVGGELLASDLLNALQSDPEHPLASARVRMLRERSGVDKPDFAEWWVTQLQASMGTAREEAWLAIGGYYGQQDLPTEVANKLALTSPAAQRAAISVGIAPDAGTEAAGQLLRAVLDGQVSEMRGGPFSEAGALLRAMRPQWFLGHKPREFDNGHEFQNDHLHLEGVDKSTRADAWNRLISINPSYESLKTAARVRRRGQSGTTEPWQNPARELTRIHGPSWLAAEIAIAGAATLDTYGSGSRDRDGVPFGANADYGTFVVEVHKRPGAEWWQSMYDQYTDTLSRRTWALALLATGSEEVLGHHLKSIDSVLESLSMDDFMATAASSSRIGTSTLARSLSLSFIWRHPGTHLRTQLLLAHFYGSRAELHTMDAMSDRDLFDMAFPHPAGWPIAQALAVRMLNSPSAIVLDALSRLGSTCTVGFRQDGTPLASHHLDRILDQSAKFPREWVAAAERWRSLGSEEGSLDAVARREGWLPNIPRLS